MANERRLIDANALKKQCTIQSPEPYNTDAGEVLGTMNEAPTVDAVEVVRCGQCKYFNERYVCTFHSERPREYGDEYHMYMMPDGFCSYGKRRCEGDNELPAQ